MISPAHRELGDRLRAARAAAGLTQERLAELSGLHRTYIGTLETGNRNPSLTSILLVAGPLGIDPGDLITGLQYDWPKPLRPTSHQPPNPKPAATPHATLDP